MREEIWIFKHKGRICAITKNIWPSERLGTTHNGYVMVHPRNRDLPIEGVDELETVAITWAGQFPGIHFDLREITPEDRFVGFDTAHAWNYDHPETQTFEAVKQKTIELVEEMICKGM